MSKKQAPTLFPCPACEKPAVVIRTRDRADGTIRRVRACRSCGNQFPTVERADKPTPKGKR